MAKWSVCGLLLAVSMTAWGADTKQESHWDQLVTECQRCHEDLTKQFRITAHGKELEFGKGPHDSPCGNCHTGDLRRHIARGDAASVTNQAKEKPEVVEEFCLTCHANERHMMFWRGVSMSPLEWA